MMFSTLYHWIHHLIVPVLLTINPSVATSQDRPWMASLPTRSYTENTEKTQALLDFPQECVPN